MEETHVFFATIADGKTAASSRAGTKTAKTHPESAFGWVLIGWALGCSMKTIHSRRIFVSNKFVSEGARISTDICCTYFAFLRAQARSLSCFCRLCQMRL